MQHFIHISGIPHHLYHECAGRLNGSSKRVSIRQPAIMGDNGLPHCSHKNKIVCMVGRSKKLFVLETEQVTEVLQYYMYYCCCRLYMDTRRAHKVDNLALSRVER